MPLRFLAPPRGPIDLNWFCPLVRFAARCRDDGQIWPVHVDEFRYRGRVVRAARRPTLHAYEHLESGGALVLDGDGQPYRWITTDGGAGLRFLPMRTLTAAVWRTGIPHVSRLVYERRPVPAVEAGSGDAA